MENRIKRFLEDYSRFSKEEETNYASRLLMCVFDELVENTECMSLGEECHEEGYEEDFETHLHNFLMDILDEISSGSRSISEYEVDSNSYDWKIPFEFGEKEERYFSLDRFANEFLEHCEHLLEMNKE